MLRDPYYDKITVVAMETMMLSHICFPCTPDQSDQVRMTRGGAGSILVRSFRALCFIPNRGPLRDSVKEDVLLVYSTVVNIASELK